MGLESAINLLQDVFINTSFFETLMIPQMIIIFGTMLLITRETSKWKMLALPVMVGWNIFGMYISTVFMIGAGIFFVIDGLSLPVASGGLKGITGMFSRDRLRTLTRTGRRQIKEKDILSKEYKRFEKNKELFDKRDVMRNYYDNLKLKELEKKKKIEEIRRFFEEDRTNKDITRIKDE